jgi:hypothetical protein
MSVPFFYLMRAYNRRFAAMARSRRARDRWGSGNHSRRFLFQGYTFAPQSVLPIVTAIVGWAWLEIKEGWRSWFAGRSKAPKVPVGSMAAATHPTH